MRFYGNSNDKSIADHIDVKRKKIGWKFHFYAAKGPFSISDSISETKVEPPPSKIAGRKFCIWLYNRILELVKLWGNNAFVSESTKILFKDCIKILSLLLEAWVCKKGVPF